MTTSTYSVNYAFGDSLSDAGNDYLLTTSSAASTLGLSAEPVSPPYAQISYSGVAANVFSNGPVWTQNLSQALGLPTLAPSGAGATANALTAALTPLLGATGAAFAVAALEASAHVSGSNPYIPVVAGASGGTDYALGGAVTGPTAENSNPAVALYDLSAQLATFQHQVPTPAANALATVSMGGNDVVNLVEDSNFATLYGTGTTLANVGSTQAGIDIAASVSNEGTFLSNLTALGVDNVLVLNVPDVGKTPEIMGHGTADAAAATVLSQYYDNLLSTDVAALNGGSVHIAIADSFSLIDNAVANPGSYGLSNVTAPVYSGSSSSFNAGDLVSSVPAVQNTYLFFDKLHPTETGQLAVAQIAEQALGVACFAAGTRIGTADGEVPVERLRAGARVLLAGGGTAPVIWLGHRHIDCRRHPRPQDVLPVRVRADAFGDGQPVRDLRLSPDHAVFIYGVLIPIRYLINGATVAQERVAQVTYYHIELPSHEVILAEGLPTESYLDLGNRGAFDNGGGALVLHPDFAKRVWDRDACAELIFGGPVLAAVKQRLLLQAGWLGHETTDDPDVRVLANGRLLPVDVAGRSYRVCLPPAARGIRLVSRKWVPAHMLPDADDTRAFGVAISRLFLDRHEIALDDPRLSSGWHATEPEWRWTDGHASLALAGVRELAFDVAMTGRYWKPRRALVITRDRRVAAAR